MTEPAYPRLSTTLCLFTFVGDDEIRSLGPLGLARSSDEAGGMAFGRGLFVVTRSQNDAAAGQGSSSKPVLPATLVGASESVRQASTRVLREELGITVPVRLRDTGIFDEPGRAGSERVISITSWGFVDFADLGPLLGGRDRVGLELVSSTEFLRTWKDNKGLDAYDGVSRFGLRYRPSPTRGHEKVLSEEINGDTILDLDYDQMVFYSWRALRRGFMGALDPFRCLGAAPLPPAFRLSTLREMYEVAQGQEIHPDQFRRAVDREGSFLRRLPGTDTSRQGKPATKYTLQEWADPRTAPRNDESN